MDRVPPSAEAALAWAERLIQDGFQKGEIVIVVGEGGGVRMLHARPFPDERTWTAAEMAHEVARTGVEG